MTFSERYFGPSLSFATLKRFIDYTWDDDMGETRVTNGRNTQCRDHFGCDSRMVASTTPREGIVT